MRLQYIWVTPVVGRGIGAQHNDLMFDHFMRAQLQGLFLGSYLVLIFLHYDVFICFVPNIVLCGKLDEKYYKEWNGARGSNTISYTIIRKGLYFW